MKRLSCFCCLLVTAIPASGEWMLIDDFQAYSDGQIFTDVTEIGWHGISPNETDEYWMLGDPDERENTGLYVEAGNYGANYGDTWCQKEMPGEGIAPGETGTLYWRGYWSGIGPDKDNPYTWYLGTADKPLAYDPVTGKQTAPGAWDDFNAVIRLGEDQNFEHWDNGNYVATDPPVYAEKGVWYSLWMVVENSWNMETSPPMSTGSYTLYIQSPDDPLPVRIPVGDDPSKYKADFQRTPADAEGMPQSIIWLQFATSSGVPSTTSAGRPFLLDDLYFSPGANLSNPLAEHGSWGGYALFNAEGDVDTGDFLGWVNVFHAPYLYPYGLGWLYMPEPEVEAPGAWAYFGKPADSLATGLLLHLPFDEGSIKDTSGHSRFTLLYQAVPGEGAFTDCFWFDGVDDYIRVMDYDYGPNFSVAFWFNSDENAGEYYQYMFSHGQVHQQNTANYYFCEDSHELNPGQIKTNPLDEDDIEASELLFTDAGLSDGMWHHYAVTAGQDGTKVYIDGEFWKAALDLGGDPIDPVGQIYIGSRWDRAADRSYEGYLDDIRMYDRALSAEEIKKLKERGR